MHAYQTFNQTVFKKHLYKIAKKKIKSKQSVPANNNTNHNDVTNTGFGSYYEII